MPAINRSNSQVAQDLHIDAQTILPVGTWFVGLSGSHAYAWGNGEVKEFKPGQFIDMPSVSSGTVQRLSGAKFSGLRPDGVSVFLSESNAVYAKILEPIPALAVVDAQQSLSKAMAYAMRASDVDHVLTSASLSAARKYATYTGKKVTVEDANDEYDLELTKGEQFQMTYLNRDRYELILKDEPKIQFIIRGHIIAANIMGRATFTKGFGSVAASDTGSFQPVGIISKNVANPINVAAGTALYQSRKKFYLGQNLVVPIDKYLSASDVSKIVSQAKEDSSLKAIESGREVRAAIPKLKGATKVKSVAPIKRGQTLDVVYGAFYPVSPNTPNRSRIVFDTTMAKAQERAREAIAAMPTPVDYFLFQTATNDELYDAAKDGRVVIRASGLLASRYKTAKKVSMTVAGADDYQAPEYVEPASNAPDLTIPAIAENKKEIVASLLRMVTEGYFVTGLHLAEQQPEDALRFSAAAMTDELYGRVVAGSRRIAAYFVEQGVDMRGKVVVARGKRTAEIRFKLPEPNQDQAASIASLQSDPPTLNSPGYETIKPKQPTVEVIAVNIHKGTVTVRPQRGPELYGAPYDVLYNNVVRKKLY